MYFVGPCEKKASILSAKPPSCFEKYRGVLTVSLHSQQDHPVPKKQLQLVGVTAMFIAAKYEEMYPPEIYDFAYVTDHTYTTANIREMEMTVLRVLDFSLGRPLPIQFLRRGSKIAEVSVCGLPHDCRPTELAPVCQLGQRLCLPSSGGRRATRPGQVLPGALHGGLRDGPHPAVQGGQRCAVAFTPRLRLR
jgi:hypothetical protein